MSSVDTAAVFESVCSLDSITPMTGVCARVRGRQVAIFRVADSVYALDNHDPFSGAAVMSRGIVGDVGGELYVASPIYKQRFALADGHCLDDDERLLTSWPARIVDGTVEVAVD